MRSFRRRGRENVEARLVADIALHDTEDGRFVWNFANARLAERQRHVRDGRSDKHNNPTENPRKKNFHLTLVCSQIKARQPVDKHLLLRFNIAR